MYSFTKKIAFIIVFSSQFTFAGLDDAIFIQGQIGIEAFQARLEQQRSKIIAVIGVDGYDYIPQLLQKYRDSM